MPKILNRVGLAGIVIRPAEPAERVLKNMRNDNPNLKKQITFTTTSYEFMEALRTELKKREGVRPGPSRVVNMAMDCLARSTRVERKAVMPERAVRNSAHAAA